MDYRIKQFEEPKKMTITMGKEELRKEYEAETGKSHGNAYFSTTDYACWLEKRIKTLEAEKEDNTSWECSVCGKPETAAYSPCCSMDCWSEQFEEPKKR